VKFNCKVLSKANYYDNSIW